MTVAEVMEQAQTLSVHERKELAKWLIDSLEVAPLGEQTDDPAEEHWGQKLNRLIDSFGPSDWGDPSITDPVEAVQAIRQQQMDRLAPYWNGEK